ncbi:CS domain [Trypanosoma melophagium]|uniref:CS domain n=1 Tax=Trypanosoma melophagium TaxID=715481 RepID=UPI003519F99C|nr:CS domain [Trypanosoma melophagium]
MSAAEVVSHTDAQQQEEHVQQEGGKPEASSEAGKKKKNANLYYYWHGHEKDRAKVGDVAPMPKPVLVNKTDECSPSAAVMTYPITKYSWGDGEKAVTVYVDTKLDGKETMAPDTLQVVFNKRKLTLEYTANVEKSATDVVQRKKQLLLRLSKAIKVNESSYKLKDATGQIVLRLVKEEPISWWELVDKDAKSSNEDSDDEGAPSPTAREDELE